MKRIVGFISGVLFGAGLIVADMTNPAKVLNFLDITGAWDPSLAFVMVGAIGVTFFGYRYLAKRSTSYLGEPLACSQPPSKVIDARLLIGAALFGAGWGIAGLCPGPSLAVIPMAPLTVAPFIGGLIIGFVVFEVALKKR